MKNYMRGFAAAAASAAVMAGSVISAYAADFTADTSEAVEAENWGQSLVIYRTEEGDSLNHFDPALMTPDSQVLVDYELIGFEGTPSEPPVEFIIQGWDSGAGVAADGVTWGKVTPSYFDEGHAVFEYEDIVTAYTNGLATEYRKSIYDTHYTYEELSAEYGNDILLYSDAVYLGVTQVCAVKCTGFTVTNILDESPVREWEQASEEDGGEDKSQREKDREKYNSGLVRTTGGDIKFNPSNDFVADGNECMRITKFDFDATRIIAGTKIIVEYETENDTLTCPVKLTVESRNNTDSPKADSNGNVCEIVNATSYDNHTAAYTYQAITQAYGTGLFSELTDFVFSASGANVKVIKVSYQDALTEDAGKRPADRQVDETVPAEKPPVPVGLIVGSVALVGVAAAFIVIKVKKK